MNHFIMNPQTEEYVRLQRTNLRSSIPKRYYDNIREDFKSIEPYLNDFKSVLDIGCGIAGIEYFLAKHCPDSTLYLLDTTLIEDSVYYGYRIRGCFYNSLQEAVGFLVYNGVENNIHTIDASKPDIKLPSVDLVISLISWGFHYPLSTYLKKVDSSMNPGGIIILDIRKGTYRESQMQLNRLGYSYTPILERQKYHRVLIRKS